MKPQNLRDIQSILAGKREELARDYGVTQIGVFGSWARDEATEDSDIDLLVEFEHSPGFFKFLELEEQLSAWLGAPVDLTTKGALKPRIGRRILNEVVML